jgi:hypothetical protein
MPQHPTSPPQTPAASPSGSAAVGSTRGGGYARPGGFRRRSVALLLAGQAAAISASAAAPPGLPRPSGDAILTVSGKVRVTNADGAADFDRAMLERLGTSSFTTTTPWFGGAATFEGILVTKLMQAVGAHGETVAALALNDYATEIPMSDFEQFGVLLALKRDGSYMSVRDKGPLFIIYPFDTRPDLKARRYYSRCAWQLRRLVVG